MKILKKVKQALGVMEDADIPFLHFSLLFLAAVTLRNFLEIFSDTAELPFRQFLPQQGIYFSVWKGLAISLMHYYVFWLTLALTVSLIFFAITREDIVKILRVIFPSFLVVNITPLFDLAISGGKGIDINYITFKDIFAFQAIPRGLTTGMVVTSSVGIILAFIYCWVKTENLKKGLLAGMAVYILLLFLSLLPAVIRTDNPIYIIRTLLLVIFTELLVLFYLVEKSYFFSLLKDARWLKMSHFYLMFILGVLLVKGPLVRVLRIENATSFLLTCICLFLCWVSAIMFNNLGGREREDSAIPKQEYEKIALWVTCLALGFGMGVNFQTFFFALVLMSSSWVYSLSPLRLERVPLISKIFISFNSLVVVMLGYIFSGGELLKLSPGITWYFLILVTLALNVIDLKDYAGDKQAGTLTLPVVLGLKGAKLLIGGFFLVSYYSVGWVLLDLRLLIPASTLGIIQFFLINQRNYREKRLLLTYIFSILLLFLYLTRCPSCP